LLVDVIVPVAKNNYYTYSTDIDLEVGDIVLVNFVNREIYALVSKINVETKENLKYKNIIEKTEFNFKKELLDLIKWTSDYYFIPLGMVLKMALSVIGSSKKKESFKQEITTFNLNNLTAEQELAKKTIQSYKNFNVNVLEGTTGSGKTEVYFHLVKDIILQDKQCLILLPEIALTTQLIKRFEEQFNCVPAVWHSSITKIQKYKIFRGVFSNETKVVIGTRSSLFLPFNNLGLIVVDEEHDSSYIQNESGCYNGKNVAIYRAKLNNCQIILSSATPSIETLINIDDKKYNSVFLENRYNALLPTINIVDLRQEKLKKNYYLSSIFQKAITNNLFKKKQTAIFLNRRGYAPIILCANCGEKIQCPNCHNNLTYHKSKNKLLCHFCGYWEEKPQKCKTCGEKNLIEFGPGVEKIEKEIQEFFPSAKTIILSSDTITTNKKLNTAIETILNNEVDIIIGTQLIAKGHHFPNLTVVGIVDSDASLYGGDIRANEKTYQLLTQMSGRAGRTEKGTVYLQTYSPDNIIIAALKNDDKNYFINFEKQSRKIGNFAPFGKMATISIIDKSEEIAYKKANAIINRFPIDEKIEIYGPAPTTIVGKYKFNIVVKCHKEINIQKLIKVILADENNVWVEMDY
jgi:primosomal protein N' (replication factor Y)